MSEGAAESIHTALADRLGTALRGVVRYDGEELTHTLREDVEELYGEEGVRRLVAESLLERANEGEQTFRLGTLEAVVRVYERSWVVRVADGRDAGCLFSIERDPGVTMAAIEDGIAIVEAELRD